MRDPLDFGSWISLLSTLAGLVLVTLVAVGIRLLVMQRVQQRRERQNRQINERLKVLIAAYKTLGGSFTGDLVVDPTHLRELRRRAADALRAPAPRAPEAPEEPEVPGAARGAPETPGDAARRRRIRDAVEAALSDVILLGTADQVRLAAQAAEDMVAGRPIETAALVRSLRDFVREALDLAPVPAGLAIPKQGPLRTAGAGSRGGADGSGGRGSGGGGAGGGAMAGGMLGFGAGRRDGDPDPASGADSGGR